MTSRDSLGVLASTTGTGLKKIFTPRPNPHRGSLKRFTILCLHGRATVLLQFIDPYIPFEEDLRRRYKITAPTTTRGNQ